jgi:membrane protein implicated in regulation of membrane protease activity
MWLWIWLVVAVVAAIGEVMTFDLFLASVAVAALIMAPATLFIAPELQVGAFAVLSLLGIFIVRPAVKHALKIEGASREHVMNDRHLIGRRAVVMQRVDAGGGQIRIGQGEFWSARPYNPTDIIESGTAVEVVLVQGLTALVEPVQLLESEAAMPAEEKGIPAWQ